jgi:hypothetical protein
MMARSVNSPTALPDPAHPFARWAGVTVVGLWAVGAQSLSEPFNKLVALLSPGIGYLVGHSLDRFIQWLDLRSNEKALRRQLDAIDARIAHLNKQKKDALTVGANQSIIELVDTTIEDAIKARVRAIAPPMSR